MTAPFAFTDSYGDDCKVMVSAARRMGAGEELYDATLDDLTRAVEAQGFRLVDAEEWERLKRFERLGEERAEQCFVFKRADLEKALKASEEARVSAEQQVEQLTARVGELTASLATELAHRDEIVSALEEARDEACGELVLAADGFSEELSKLRAQLSAQSEVVEAALAFEATVMRTPEWYETRANLAVALGEYRKALASAGSEPKRAGGESESGAAIAVGARLSVFDTSAQEWLPGGTVVELRDSEIVTRYDDGGEGRLGWLAKLRVDEPAPATEEPACRHEWESHFSAQMCHLCGRCRHGLLAQARAESATEEPAPKQWEQGYGRPWDCDHEGTVRSAEGLVLAESIGREIGDFIVTRCNAPAGVPVERVEALRDAVHQAIQEAARVASPKLVAIRTELNIMLGIEPAEHSELPAKRDAGGGG